MSRLLKITLTLLLPLTISHMCGGAVGPANLHQNQGRALLTRGSSLSPIRFFFSYINFDLGSSSKNTYFKTKVIPSVERFFTRSLKVYPVVGSLVLTSTTCLENVSVPSEHRTTGLENTDIVVYITSKSMSNWWTANAGACEREKNGRQSPIAGRILINTSKWTGDRFHQDLSLLTHEMTHLLGFNSYDFQYWKDSDGNSYSEVTRMISYRGSTRKLVVTPNVQKRAREVFGCSTIEGIELEDNYGDYSHWEKRIMMSDFMNSIVPYYAVWSSITLALLKDTGWYEVDDFLATDTSFGKAAGCSYFQKSCYEAGASSNSSLWCSETKSWICDIYRINKGSCKMSSGDSYADGCSYATDYSNGNCRNYLGADVYTQAEANEVISISSRCFESTLSTKSSPLSSITASCYEVLSCSSTDATVKVGNQTVKCPFTGGFVTVQGFVGKLTCPNSSILCQDVPCKNMCYARGSCSMGNCQCESGFGGDDCSLICPENCGKCDLNACLKCKTGFNLASGSCIGCSVGCITCTGDVCKTCDKGFFLESGKCRKCIEFCIGCNSLVDCSECQAGYLFSNGKCNLNCKIGCRSCNAPDSCSSCKDGYFLLSSQCISCSSPCLNCESSSKCITCITGYTLSGTSCILECPSNCVSCTSKTSCSTCNSGFYISSGSCKSCLNPCKECSASNKCTSCTSSYFLGGGTCKTCPLSCLSCSSLTVCSSCNSGFYLSSSKTCLACPSNCATCSSSSCQSCLPSFKLVNGNCSICIVNCLSCENSSTCKVCEKTFYVSSTNGICKKCVEPCKECSSFYKCTTCLEGFILSGTSCIKCLENCVACTSNSKCDSCSNGFYVSSTTGACKKCVSPCKECSSYYKCSSCLLGYQLVENSCIICPQNCSKCNTSSICEKCKPGFYVSSSTLLCKSCVSPCKECTTSSSCTSCVSGYILKKKSCKKKLR